MDSITSNNTNNYHQSSTGLLRFRFAPSSMLSNYFTEDEVDNMVSLEVDDKSLLRSTYSYSDLPPYYPRKLTVSAGMESNNSHGLFESAMGINQREEVKRVDSNGSSCLSRQNSSPAGFFGNLSVQNGHATVKGIGDYGGLNGSIASPRLKMLSYSSRLPSSLGMLSQISEVGSESFESDSPRGGKLGDEDVDSRLFGNPGFAYGAWNNYGIADNLSGLKREQDSTQKLFPNGLIRELENRVHVLSHHLSLPKTYTDMIGMEKFLHFQNSVPCKVRAKRGCATHPRSIAERVRRTRISERMRKLQDLIPNMDKQTNTTDMLDLAVEYIKDLQKEYKILSDNRTNCKCSCKQQKAVQNQIM